jgi:anti-sigma regulatory factor (Ser/Thr protein kinase)
LAQLYAMRADFERARMLYRRGRAALEDLGAKVQATAVAIYSGRVELLAGDPVAAEERMRPAYETFRMMGERATCSTLAAILGEAVFAQGRYDEAETLGRVSEEIASADDFDAQYRWRALRAKIRARSGAVSEAEATAREAVRIVQMVDNLVANGLKYSPAQKPVQVNAHRDGDHARLTVRDEGGEGIFVGGRIAHERGRGQRAIVALGSLKMGRIPPSALTAELVDGPHTGATGMACQVIAWPSFIRHRCPLV